MRPHERLYRCLLFILPPSMRQEAGDELLETFNQEYRAPDAGRVVARTVLDPHGGRSCRGFRCRTPRTLAPSRRTPAHSYHGCRS